MTQLATKNFTTLVQSWAAIAQSSVASVRPSLVLNFSRGAILLALAQAQASVSLWLQGLVLKLLTATRLQTSVGSDVDSFIADFGLTRLPAAAASGLVTFSRNVAINPATIPIGALMQSADGSNTYAVTLDTTNAYYSASADGYVIPAQITSIQAPVACTVAGAAGNVQAGGITVLQTGISGVDTITNVAAFVNGYDEESDAAVRARFVLFINSLSKGTEGAIGYAIASTQQGLQSQIIEPGVDSATILTVYIDDGTGAIPDSSFNGAAANAQLARAAGVQMATLKATMLAANVVMTIATATGYDHNTLVAQVVAAITAYINGLGLGATPSAGQLSYMKLATIAFGVQGVTDVTNYTLNGAPVDLVPAAGQTIKSSSITVS